MEVICVDLFCGGGGTSTGLIEAAENLKLKLKLIAINCWALAIATHSTNHPSAKHICGRVEQLRPREIVPGGRVHLLVASPECTHHSIARGGRPIEDQKRVPAWGIINWAQELYIDSIIIENVPEFRSWGPIGANGKPLKSKEGETYRAFLQALRSLDYRLEERELCCADYGDATTRKRLFIMATRRGTPSWPAPTHTAKHKIAQSSLFESAPPRAWRAAREIIDWGLKGKSIFTRKKPLAITTLQRIAAGMRTINGIDIEPFLVERYGDQVRAKRKPARQKPVDQPPGSIQPFLLSQGSGGAPRPVNQPVPTICTQGAVQMLEPFVVSVDQQGGNGNGTKAVEQPLTTVTTKGRHALTQAFLVGAGGPARAGEPRSLDKPLQTVLTRQTIAMVNPFLVAAGGPEGKGRRAKDVEQPLDTVLTENHDGVVQPFLVTVNHRDENMASGGGRCQSVDSPLPTLTCNKSLANATESSLPVNQCWPALSMKLGGESTDVAPIKRRLPRLLQSISLAPTPVPFISTTTGTKPTSV